MRTLLVYGGEIVASPTVLFSKSEPILVPSEMTLRLGRETATLRARVSQMLGLYKFTIPQPIKLKLELGGEWEYPSIITTYPVIEIILNESYELSVTLQIVPLGLSGIMYSMIICDVKFATNLEPAKWHLADDRGQNRREIIAISLICPDPPAE